MRGGANQLRAQNTQEWKKCCEREIACRNRKNVVPGYLPHLKFDAKLETSLVLIPGTSNGRWRQITAGTEYTRVEKML